MPKRSDWTERLISVKAEHEDWGARKITKFLEEKAAKQGGPLPPPWRTVARILARTWQPLEDDEKAEYRLFYWPESMESGDLPWEASGAGLRCLELFELTHDWRPTVRLVRWFWKIVIATPGAPEGVQWMIANRLAVADAWGILAGGGYRAMEGYLKSKPWESDDKEAKYRKAVGNGEIPGLDSIPAFGNDEGAAAVLKTLEKDTGLQGGPAVIELMSKMKAQAVEKAKEQENKEDGDER